MTAKKRRASIGVAEPAAESIHVRLPLSPELVRTIREHVENAIALRDLLLGPESAASDVAEAFARAAQAVDRDAKRVRRALKRRR